MIPLIAPNPSPDCYWLRVPASAAAVVAQGVLETSHEPIAKHLFESFGAAYYGHSRTDLEWGGHRMEAEHWRWLLHAHALLVFIGFLPDDATCCDYIREEHR